MNWFSTTGPLLPLLTAHARYEPHTQLGAVDVAIEIAQVDLQAATSRERGTRAEVGDAF